MKQRILIVTVPDDDWEDPKRLVEAALQHYLEYGDRWREVEVKYLVGNEED